MSFDFYKTLSE